MQATSHRFPENARGALADLALQGALTKMKTGFVEKRAAAAAKLPEFEQLRDDAKAIKDHVHWCRDAEEARQVVLSLCRSADAKSVTKGKSMIGEEIGLNDFLERHEIEPVETDLGEYIIQLRKEPPSHIIAPAIHVPKAAVETAFRAAHRKLPEDRVLEEPRALVDEARAMLRQKYLDADVGITGANLLIAETGQTVIVTNEGNGDLTQSLPNMHIVLASIEKIVPALEDAATILRVLARSATGQEFSTYTTFSAGTRREGDPDGPNAFHVVLLDNGRSDMLGSEFQEMLRCIRCGACMNHCPVYGAVGGHAYGWVYPGPMGAVLTPTLIGVDQAGHLPNASTFCGRCESVCPVRIPLPKLMRHWRERQFTADSAAKPNKLALALWSFFAMRPALYRRAMGLGIGVLSRIAGARGRFRRLPFAGGWTDHRDLPAPARKSFQAQWRKRGSA